MMYVNCFIVDNYMFACWLLWITSDILLAFLQFMLMVYTIWTCTKH